MGKEHVVATGRRLLICSENFPHPTRGGSMVILYNYILHFKRMGFDILHWMAVADREGIDAEEAEYRRAMEDGDNFRVVVHRVGSHYQRRSRRDVVRRIRTTVTSREVSAQLPGFRPDVVFCFDILSAALLKDAVAGPKVVWLGDLAFQTSWYHAWYAFRESVANVKGLPFAWAASRAWRQFYRRTLRGLDAVIVSAKASERVLQRCGISSVYLPFPWPRGRQSAEPFPARASKPTFLFLGNLSGLGSRSALHFLLEALYGNLLGHWGAGGFEILICGTHGLPAWVEPHLEAKREIRYLGFVDDLDALMRRCHGVIAPIDVPVGNRTRILTAMAARMPVIAHSSTALANPALIDGETCLLADDAQNFGRKMRRVYEDDALRRTLGDKAFQRYLSTFDPETASALMGKVLLAAVK